MSADYERLRQLAEGAARPPLQRCNAHGPYRAWHPLCPDCLREQQREGREQERRDRLERPGPVPYGEFPPGY